MARIVADISMSLDGFVTGPDPGPAQGLGAGGEALHVWAFDEADEVSAGVLRRATEATGAVVMGRRLFDLVDGPHGWDDEVGYGARHAAQPPVFVVTHEPPTSVRLADRFTFVTVGVAAAVEQAAAVAREREVVVMGGGEIVRQAIVGGLVDELRLHLAPVVLGAGTPLFTGPERVELVVRATEPSPNATHLTYGVSVIPPS